MVNENEIKKALNLPGDFTNGIYEEKHGRFVIDLTDLNKTGTGCFMGCIYKKGKENRDFDLIWNFSSIKELKEIFKVWQKATIFEY